MIALSEAYTKGSANDEWYIHPDTSGHVSIEELVSGHVTSILSLHYPAPEGMKLKCHPKALHSLGGALFIKLHNMVTEVQQKNVSMSLNIEWVEGVPNLQVKSSNIIIP
jgi:hypothetical protein